MSGRRAMTYDEQVKMIRKKGFILYDDEVKDCIAFLKKVNYYRFSAYFLPFQREDRSFEKGISFFRLERIYEFDSRVRALLFEIIEDVEVALRTGLSYYVCNKYGPFGHLNDAMYSRGHDERGFQSRVRNCEEKNRNSPVIQQNREKNNGEVPLWVIIEFFSMGMLVYFYRDMKAEDKKIIASDIFGADVKRLESWLRCVIELRNRCAHYLRLYGWNFQSVPLPPQGLAFEPDHKLFSQIMALRFLYPDEREWDFKLTAAFRPLVEEYREDVEFSHIGFADDWEKRLAEDWKQN